ncbi:MAG TPA: hypothetical protein VIK57_11845 [Streptosporangiaceae bacterium]
MNRSTIDVKTEVRKLAASKPVHAAAGAGVLASAALRELPAKIARWRSDGSLAALPGLASEYMTTARTKAVQEYDRLATRGARVLNGKTALPGKGPGDKKS